MNTREKLREILGKRNASILVCSSTNHMLHAGKLLEEAGIETDLIPTPRGLGSACTTAIKFPREAEEQVKEIIAANSIAYEGIYPLESKRARKVEWVEVYLHPMREEYRKVLKRAENEEPLTKEDICLLLGTSDPQEIKALYTAADKVRQECVGDTVDIRGAIEFSNYCRKNCYYCGIRRDNTAIKRYRMTEEEILAVAGEIHAMGLQTVILQSGEDPWYTTEKIISIIKAIKQRYGLRITLSIGERSREEYFKFCEAGANNYLLKIESADRRLFAYIHPDDDYKVRVQHTKWLKEAGFLVGSGNMVGLPTQTVESLAEDILFLRDYGIHMLGIGPFLPAENTPFANEAAGSLEMSLKVVAVARLVCQNVFIPATTAMATLHPEGQTMALRAGANTIMLIMTPPVYRSSYQIYSNKNMVDLAFAINSVRKAGRKLPGYLKQGGKE